MLTLGVLGGGYWAIQRGDHYRVYPNSLLIEDYPENAHAVSEVRRRLLADRFSDDDIRTLVNKSFTLDVTVRTPRPRGARLDNIVTLTPKPNGLCSHAFDPFDPYGPDNAVTLTLDGEPILKRRIKLETENFATYTRKSTYDFSPTVGRHTLSVSLTTNFVDIDDLTVARKIASRMITPITLTRSTEFEVRDESICALVHCLTTDEDVAFLRDSFRLIPHRRGLKSFDIDVCSRYDLTNTQLHCVIDRYVGANRVAEDRSDPPFPDSELLKPAPVLIGATLEPNERLLCRVTLDASNAFANGDTEFFPFAMEWDIDASVVTARDDFYPDCDHPGALPPDRIIRLTDDDLIRP